MGWLDWLTGKKKTPVSKKGALLTATTPTLKKSSKTIFLNEPAPKKKKKKKKKIKASTPYSVELGVTPREFAETKREIFAKEHPTQKKILDVVSLATLGGMAVAVAPVGTIPVVAKGIGAQIAKHPVAALFGAGLVTTPAGRELISKVPGKIFQTGITTGEVLEDPSKLKDKNILEILAAVGITGGAIIGGKYIYDWAKDRKDKTPDIPTLPVEKPVGVPTEKSLGVAGQSPILPETTKVTPTRKTYKRRRAKKISSVRQSVRVNVIASPRATGMKLTNKRYINTQLLN